MAFDSGAEDPVSAGAAVSVCEGAGAESGVEGAAAGRVASVVAGIDVRGEDGRSPKRSIDSVDE
jgi:hypothetical protein